jgi:hypothetical protein
VQRADTVMEVTAEIGAVMDSRGCCLPDISGVQDILRC